MSGEPGPAAAFDPAGPLPRGRYAIEASAGTGKTYALAGLAARYVIEDGVAVGELLVVTFTRAAAAELRDRVRELPVTVSILDGDARQLPFPDSTFDTVAASLVFCSVDDPDRALREVHRVLRPGGRFLFHEHVRGGPVRGVVQDLLTPLHRRLADGNPLKPYLVNPGTDPERGRVDQTKHRLASNYRGARFGVARYHQPVDRTD